MKTQTNSGRNTGFNVFSRELNLSTKCTCSTVCTEGGLQKKVEI